MEKLEGFNVSYDAICLESTYRLIAESQGWKLVNPLYLTYLSDDLKESIKTTRKNWNSKVGDKWLFSIFPRLGYFLFAQRPYFTGKLSSWLRGGSVNKSV